MRFQTACLKAGCAFILASCASALAQSSCDDLGNLKLEHASVVAAKWIEAGPLKLPAGLSGQVQEVQVDVRGFGQLEREDPTVQAGQRAA